MHKLENYLSEHKFKRHLIPFSSEGGFYNEPVFFLDKLPFNELKDLENQFPDLVRAVDDLDRHIHAQSIKHLGLE